MEHIVMTIIAISFISAVIYGAYEITKSGKSNTSD